MNIKIINSIFNYIIVSVSAQSLLLVFTMLLMKKNRKANIFFAVFIIIISLNFFAGIFDDSIKLFNTIIFIIVVPTVSLAGVFIYLYTKFITGMENRLRLKHLLHFIVYFICLILSISAFTHQNYIQTENKIYDLLITIVLGIGQMCSIVYLILTFITIKRYDDKIKDYYSEIEHIKLAWVRLLTFLAIIVLVLSSAEFTLSLVQKSFNEPVFLVFEFLGVLSFAIIIFSAMYHIVNQADIFKQNAEMINVIDDTAEYTETEKYAKLSLNENIQTEYLEKLLRYMDESKPYLDESITLKGLSGEIGILPNYLSMIINSRLGKNFYTFINEYRIKEALSIFDDPEKSDASIIAVAYRSGFNSKSTFNRIFKTVTGKTPSEYKSRAEVRSEPIR